MYISEDGPAWLLLDEACNRLCRFASRKLDDAAVRPHVHVYAIALLACSCIVSFSESCINVGDRSKQEK